LKDGGDFAQLAIQFSEDQFSFNRGGELPPFGTGVYDPVFEEKAFELKEGEISTPFETAYGYHFLLLDKKIPYTSTLDSLNKADLIEQIQSSDREMIATRQLIERISGIMKVKDQPVDKSSLAQFTRSVLANPSSVADMGLKPSTVLIAMDGKNITVADYRKHLQQLGQAGNFGDQPAEDFYEGFKQNVILDYYQQNIERFDPVFKKQMQEFKEGSMLFYMMEKYVWSVSASDTAGARNFYELNKNRYWWNKSADVLIFTSSNKELIETIKEAIVKVPERWEEIRDKYESQLTVDSARYEFSQIPGNPGELKNGEVTPVVQLEDMYSVAYAVNVYNDRSPRTYEEAQGLVINDYQSVLEERWINKLKKKYPVKLVQNQAQRRG
jgi:peptidyl-prolyl cis-trans isomerase SurA